MAIHLQQGDTVRIRAEYSDRYDEFEDGEDLSVVRSYSYMTTEATEEYFVTVVGVSKNGARIRIPVEEDALDLISRSAI